MLRQRNKDILLLQISPHSLLEAKLSPCQRSLAQGKHTQPPRINQSPETHLFLGELQALRVPAAEHQQVKPTGDMMWCHWFSSQHPIHHCNTEDEHLPCAAKP